MPSYAFQDAPFELKGALIGILPVAMASFSELIISPLRERIASWFGFTEPEVARLLFGFGLGHRAEDVRNWYSGYRFHRHTIYNPWSVVSFIKVPAKVSIPHWVNTSENLLVQPLILSQEADPEIRWLLQGQKIVQRLDEDVSFRSLKQDTQTLCSL